MIPARQRAAIVMCLIQSAKLNGHDPYRYLKDFLARLPTQSASRLEELLPHHWAATAKHPLTAHRHRFPVFPIRTLPLHGEERWGAEATPTSGRRFQSTTESLCTRLTIHRK